MATNSLNNGLFLRDNNYKASSHLDSYHLQNMLKDAKPMDLGPVELWAMTQKVEMPLYQFSDFGGKNVIEVDNIRGEYKWETPISNDLPYIVEDIATSNTTKGIDGTKFPIKVSRREFGPGDIITYDKYNGLEMYICPEDEITQASDAFVYTVQLVNNDSTRYLDNKYLANGTKLFRVGSARGEYGENYSDIISKTGFREFYNFVGGAEAHVHYTISSRAAMQIKGGLNADGTVPVTEIWRNFDDSVDPSIPTITKFAQVMGSDYMKRAMDNGTLTRTYLTALDDAHMTKIARDIENYLMWGKGGRMRQDGPDDIRLSVGLWQQLNSAFKFVYNKGSFNLDLFRTQLYDFFMGKVEFQGPQPNRRLKVQTGIGGMQMISTAITKEANALGWVIQAAEKFGVGAVTGQGMNLGFGYAFTSVTIPFLAVLDFELNPAFDNVNNNAIENPLVDGFPLSSYSFIIYDVTDNTNDNIYMLKLKHDNQFKWRYINGTMDYMGRTSGFQSSGNFNGYQVYMSQTFPAIWVRDPTKILKIVMRNSITGSSF